MSAPFPGSYYAASAQPLDAFPPLDGSTTADVCVVGGGFTGINTAIELAERGLSVRQTEQLVYNLLNPKKKAPRKLKTSRDIQRFEEELSDKFGTKVEIKPGRKGSGKLVISYSSHEHLDDLLSKFKG